MQSCVDYAALFKTPCLNHECPPQLPAFPEDGAIACSMPGESSAVPAEDRGGLNHLQASPESGPEPGQHNPQEPSQRWRRKRRGAFFWKTVSWWRSARISACRAARVRKLDASKAKRATKRELIVVATIISQMVGTPVFSDRTEFSVTTPGYSAPLSGRGHESPYWGRPIRRSTSCIDPP